MAAHRQVQHRTCLFSKKALNASVAKEVGIYVVRVLVAIGVAEMTYRSGIGCE